MRKWEQKYEEFSNSKELEEKMDILEDKINGKVAFKEEYEEFKKLSAIKENLPKVKNILQLREKLENENKEINEEIKKRESRVKISQTVEKLEKELEGYDEEYSKIEVELKSGKLTETEKNAKKLKLKEIETKKQKNNIEFGKYQDQLKIESEEITKSKYKDISTDELKEQAYQGKMKISKCNMACNKLMQGYSWSSVEVALDKFEKQRLTAKGKDAEKMKQNRESAKALNEKEQVKIKEEESRAESVKVEDNEENKMVVVEENKKTFFEKIKNIFNKVKNAIKKDKKIENEIEEKSEEKAEEKAEEAKVEEKAEEKVEEAKVEEKSKKDSFKEYLKFVAENGVKEAEEKAKEDELVKITERLVEDRRKKAEQVGKAFDEEATRKKARIVAENSYKKKHQPTQQATQENNGQDR